MFYKICSIKNLDFLKTIINCEFNTQWKKYSRRVQIQIYNLLNTIALNLKVTAENMFSQKKRKIKRLTK